MNTQGHRNKNDVRDALLEAIRLNIGDTQKASEDTVRRLNKELLEISAKKREVIEKIYSRSYQTALLKTCWMIMSAKK